MWKNLERKKKKSMKLSYTFQTAYMTGYTTYACATSGFPEACLRPTWQKEWPSPRAWGGTSGDDTPAPPRNRKLSLGALTLGTKSNLDLEPGEEWHREVAWWGGMLRRAQGIFGLIAVRF